MRVVRVFAKEIRHRDCNVWKGVRTMRKCLKSLAGVGAVVAVVAGVVVMWKKREDNRVVERQLFQRSWEVNNS